MSTVDLLRAHAPAAPEELHRRVSLLRPEPRRRARVRPVLVLAAAATIAVLAAVVHGFSTSAPQGAQSKKVPALEHLNAQASGGAATATTPVFGAATDQAVRAAAVPAPAPGRLQHTDASIRVQVDDVGGATTRATRIATALGGYAQSVRYRTPQTRVAVSYIELRIPAQNVKRALAQLGGHAEPPPARRGRLARHGLHRPVGDLAPAVEDEDARAGLLDLAEQVGAQDDGRRALARDPLDDAHTISWALQLLEHVGDKQLVDRVTGALPQARYFLADPDDPSYGLTPLDFAPTPASRWRSLFSDDVVAAHLDRLQRDQQDDGGWPLSWQPPGMAATYEYRTRETLDALRRLVAYGRVAPPLSS
jgi:hypothetical protein